MTPGDSHLFCTLGSILHTGGSVAITLSFAFVAARVSGQVSRAINLLELPGYS